MAYESTPVVGIDLGTSEARIAVWKNGQIQIIPDHSTKRAFIPSYVSFTDTEILVGEPAKNQLGRNRKNTVFDVKRLIGRAEDGTLLPTRRFYWPFRVSLTVGKAQVSVNNYGSKQEYYPERIMSRILIKMIVNAERFLGHSATQAVMTVPTYFNDYQRNQATTGVANIASVNLLHVIDNSTAAALAYCHKNNLKDAGLVLVYDMGTYAFEVSVLNVYDFNPKMVLSESHEMLGGKNIDQLMVSQCMYGILQDYNPDFRSDEDAMSKFYPACEEAKKTLSFQNETVLEIHNLWKGRDFSCKVTREHLEALCTEIINITLIVVEQALSKAKIHRSQIEHVVMVGGSTRIPKLREMAKNFFSLKELAQGIDPEEIVAYGAAVQGVLLTDSLRLDRTETSQVQKLRSNHLCETLSCSRLLQEGVHDRTHREWSGDGCSSDSSEVNEDGVKGENGTYFAKPAYGVINDEDDSVIGSDASGISSESVDGNDKHTQITSSDEETAKDKNDSLQNQVNIKGDFTSDLEIYSINNEEDNNICLESELSSNNKYEYLPANGTKTQAEMINQDETIFCGRPFPESVCELGVSENETQDHDLEKVVQPIAKEVQECSMTHVANDQKCCTINKSQNAREEVDVPSVGVNHEHDTKDDNGIHQYRLLLVSEPSDQLKSPHDINSESLVDNTSDLANEISITDKVNGLSGDQCGKGISDSRDTVFKDNVPDINVEEASSESDFDSADECNEHKSSGDLGDSVVSQVISSNDSMSRDPCQYHFTTDELHDDFGSNSDTTESEDGDISEHVVNMIGQSTDLFGSCNSEDLLADKITWMDTRSDPKLILGAVCKGGMIEILKERLKIARCKCEVRNTKSVCINIPFQGDTQRRYGMDSGPKIEITVSIDDDGILNSKSVETMRGECKVTQFFYKHSELRQKELSQMRGELEIFSNIEAMQKDKDIAKTNLENFVYKLKQVVEERSGVSEEEKQHVKNECLEALDFIDENICAKKHEFEVKLQQFKETFSQLIINLRI